MASRAGPLSMFPPTVGHTYPEVVFQRLGCGSAPVTTGEAAVQSKAGSHDPAFLPQARGRICASRRLFVNGKTTTYCAFILGQAQDVGLIVRHDLAALSFSA